MNIKNIFFSWAEVSTIHAIPNIARAKDVSLKLIWSISLTISLSFCCFVVIKSLSSFYDYEVVTTTRVISQIPCEFPTITICNYDYVMSLTKRSLENNLTNSESLTHGDKHQILITKYYNLSDENKKLLGLQLKELILSCVFNNIPCNYENDFVWFYDFFYGNCFKYNPGNNFAMNKSNIKKIDRIGKLNGLQLSINSNPNSSISEESMGVLITIHNSSINPSYNEGFGVLSGLETNIAIKRLIISQKEQPYSECIADIKSYKSILTKTILNTGYIYRQIDCFDLCFQDYFISQKGCNYPGLLKIEDVKQCSSINEIKNLTSLYQEFIKKGITQDCLIKCPKECESVYYERDIYYGRLSSFQYLGINDSVNSNYSDFVRNRLFLNIFYESLTYTHIQEVEKTSFIDLISNIGGTFGLFVGISVLSAVEVFELGFLLIASCLNNKKNIHQIKIKTIKVGLEPSV